MAAGLQNQIERRLAHEVLPKHPWQRISHSLACNKRTKHRLERRRAKADPECMPLYRRYFDYEF